MRRRAILAIGTTARERRAEGSPAAFINSNSPREAKMQNLIPMIPVFLGCLFLAAGFAIWGR